jgi:hypothetical protein
MPLLGTHNSVRLRKDVAMEQWRHNPRRRRRLPAVRLEQPHMKDVMNPGADWKLKAVGPCRRAPTPGTAQRSGDPACAEPVDPAIAVWWRRRSQTQVPASSSKSRWLAS